MNTIFTGRKGCILFLFIILGTARFAQRYPEPLTPEESLKKLNVVDGFKVQLYAAEPYVLDPVALEFDEKLIS